MTDDKSGEDGPHPLPVGNLQGRSARGRQLREQHRCRAGPGSVRRRQGSGETCEARQDASRAGAANSRVRRDGRAGRRRRPGRNGCRRLRRAPGRRRPAGRALQSPGRTVDRWSRHLDRPHVGLVRGAHHPRLCQRHHGSAAERGGARAETARLGLQGRRLSRLLGAAHRGLPRHRHLVADGRSGGPQDRIDADGGRGQGAPAAARLGRRADPGGQHGQGRDLREQGRTPRRARQGRGRHDRRCRPHRAHARRGWNPTSTKATSTIVSTRPS